MTLEEVMKQKRFVVVGDTLNETKFAYKIKHKLTEAGYEVQAVGKELASINDVEGPIDIIDLCIHPAKGIQLIRELKKDFSCIVIQPGAESDELLDYLEQNNLPHLQGCVLVGLSLFHS